MGIALDEMMVWDPDLEMGGLSAEQIRRAKTAALERALLGAPDVPAGAHPAFSQPASGRPGDRPPRMQLRGLPAVGFRRLDRTHRQNDQGSPPNTRWLVGTELNLVNRLAEEVRHEGKIVQFMAPTVCMCSTMQRIDPQHLAWTLENLADGKVVNQITVPEHERALAKLALERMLAVS
jgi:quinolinate synthase